MYRTAGKRSLDILIAFATLPLQAVAFLTVAPAIYLEDRGTIFYISERRGKNGRVFRMVKYRSMVVNAPDLRAADLSTLNSEEDPRLTRIGRLLRKTSIDELPQFFNVFLGDMSVVGPRPNMTQRPMEQLNAVELKRLSVKPGITGYSQAYYRNSIGVAEKYANDCHYVDNLSLTFDLSIIFKTISSVFARKNIYRET